MPPTTTAPSPLRAARDRLGLSREAVCRQVSPPISSKTLERWEAGATTPNRLQLEQLAEIYRRDADRLERELARWRQTNGGLAA